MGFKILAGFAIILVLLSGYETAIHFAGNRSDSGLRMAAFNSNSENPELEALHKRISGMIRKKSENIGSFGMTSVALNFLVTLASGMCALITSISMVKYNSVSRKSGIAVAAIAFLSTLLNWGQSELNDFRSREMRKIEDIKSVRESVRACTKEELAAEIPLFNDKLDEFE